MVKRRNSFQGGESNGKNPKVSRTDGRYRYTSPVVYIRQISSGVTKEQLESFLILRLNRAFEPEFLRLGIQPRIQKVDFQVSSNRNSTLEAVVVFEDARCSRLALNLKKTQLRNQIMEICPCYMKLVVSRVPLDVTVEELGKKLQERLCVAFPTIYHYAPNIKNVFYTSESDHQNSFQEAIVEFEDVSIIEHIMRLHTIILRGQDLDIQVEYGCDSPTEDGNTGDRHNMKNKKQPHLPKEKCYKETYSKQLKELSDEDTKAIENDKTYDSVMDPDELVAKYRAILAENAKIKANLSCLQGENESLQLQAAKAVQEAANAVSKQAELEDALKRAADDAVTKQVKLEKEVETLQNQKLALVRSLNQTVSKREELEAVLKPGQQEGGQSEIQHLRSQLRDTERRFVELTQCFTEQSKSFAQERRDFREELRQEKARVEALEKELRDLRNAPPQHNPVPAILTVKEEQD